MVGSSKILTVSYGTFSCTLEGFDDSFGTMKAIAEYFRDLASDDRYFGAVPPTPDAEMLARIAEREIAKRVEARMAGTGLVLRAGNSLPQVAPALAVEPPVKQAQPAAESTMATSAAAINAVQISGPTAQTEPAAPVDVAPVNTAPVAASSVTASSAVLQAPSQATEVAITGDDFADETNSSDHDARDMAVMDPAPDSEDAVAALLANSAPLTHTAGPLAGSDAARPDPLLAAPRPAVTPLRPADQPSAVLPAHPDSESIAAKLQRIRAVVGKAPAALNVPLDDDGTDNLLAVYDDPAPMPIVAAPEQAAAPLAPTVEQAPPSAVQAAVPAASAMPGTPQTQAAPPLRARVIRMRRADFDRAVSEGTLDQALPPSPAPSSLSAAEEADLMAELAALEIDPVDAPPVAPDAPDLTDLLSAMQVAEVQPLDQMLDAAPETAPDVADAAPEFDDLDAVLAELAQTAAPEALEPVAAMADLADLSELADLPTETAEIDPLAESFAAFEDEDEPQSAGAALAEPARRGRDMLARTEADDAAVDRLLSQTDAHLNDPEALGRRAAIMQLKAAVAATEAARTLGDSGTETSRTAESAFRDDLREAVRPRRPVAAAEARSERPRPAPLKLVASQRIDVAPQPLTDMGTVRPRRIAVGAPAPAAPDAALATSANFAAYAADMGATNLADLLEAAAAYTAFVEGSTDFSRPQLMTKLSQVSDEPFSREDTLRSFGTLLREGRITRAAAAGRFQVSDATRFHPERRAG